MMDVATNGVMVNVCNCSRTSRLVEDVVGLVEKPCMVDRMMVNAIHRVICCLMM